MVILKYINDYLLIVLNVLFMILSGLYVYIKIVIGCIYNFFLLCSMLISCVSVYLFDFKV